MPLTHCPDCSRSVSATAPACPGCGRPMRAQTIERTGKGIKALQLLCGCVILAGIGLMAARITIPALWTMGAGFAALMIMAGVEWWQHG